MHFGVYLSTTDELADAALLAELAHEAESEGWEGVFIFDHIGHPHSAVDAWVALTAMALRTERVRLGPLVTPVARRRPWKLARETVAVDRLSGGRLTLGVGLGWSELEFSAFGEESSPRIRAEKLDEGLAVLAGLWSGETLNFSGKHYRISEAQFVPTPLQLPRIPVWACGTWPNKAPFRRAARWDGAVAILDPRTNRAIAPDEVSAIRTYMALQRADASPFDLVVILWSEGEHTASEQAAVAGYADAGATWWVEDLTTERFASLEQIRERLHKGPPGAC